MEFHIRDCKDADRLIQKALDGALNPAERKALDKHIEACPTCAAAWDEHRELTRLATAWARRPAVNAAGSQDFTATVLAQIADRPRSSQRSVSPRVIWLGAACFAVLLVAAAYFLSPKLSPFWTTPQMPTLSANTPVTVWTAIAQSLRALPSDALAAWNSLFPENVSYYPALGAIALALCLAIILRLQAQRPGRRFQ